MSPFDLRGPQFLVFYVMLSFLVIGALVVLRRALESGPVPKLEPDPYLLACLRAGPNETLRVAAISLLDRGLLLVKEELLEAKEDAVTLVRRPIERKVLEAFSTASTPWSIYSRYPPYEATAALESDLTSAGLLPTPQQMRTRAILGGLTVAFLWWVALTKVRLAISRGHSNVGLLLILSLGVAVGTFFGLRSRTTSTGRRIVKDFQFLFSSLRTRAEQIQPGGATNELALLAGVFGLGALPTFAALQARALFPIGSTQRSTLVSDLGEAACGHLPPHSSGDSCGSSGGCGSGCGGGGGGCGGCGS